MKRATVGVTFLAFGLTGCGTVSNFTTQKQPPPETYSNPKPAPHHLAVYGGVRNNLDEMRWAWNQPGTGPLVALVACPLLALDIPFSFVGDTLTLPITVVAEVNRTAEEVVQSINDYYHPKDRTRPTPEPAAVPATDTRPPPE